MRKSIVLMLVFWIGWSVAMAQRNPKPKNYSRFDQKVMHFGFMLGFNTADFSTRYKPQLLVNHDVYSITNKKQPGFQLGLISSLRLGTPLVHLRFIPTLSFQERVLNYQFLSDDPEKVYENYEERVGSTNLDFPLLFKFRTLRYNNFDAYLLLGAQYTIDLQSKEKTSQSFSDPFLKISRNDFQGQVGAGVDFYLPYFKFGIELKMSHSFKDVLIHDNTRLSAPIDKLYNRVWWVSFTFEG